MPVKKCPVCQTPIEEGAQSCPCCHFKLSGATQRFTPVQNGVPEKKEDKVETVSSLVMVRGPQMGMAFNLDKDRMTIGRNPKCDIFLDDMTVSREHAEITRHGDTFIIEDMQSFNGVWINNHTVQEHALRPDDYLQIGKYDFVYTEGPSDDEEVDR